jgi:DNA-directed RNA polymerase subunit beta
MLSSAESSTLSNPAVARKRYARIPEVLPVPNLIELQLESFQWFIEKGLRERSRTSPAR